MTSIADVAARAGVSVATVSRALRGLPNVAPATRERVRQAADELGYVADPNAARLAGSATSTIGLVLPFVGSWYHSRIFASVLRAADRSVFDVLPFVLSDPDSARRFTTGRHYAKRVDGLLLVDVPLAEGDVETVHAAGVAVVTSGMAREGLPSVGIDDHGAAAEVATHLLGLGHRRIAVIGASSEDPFGFPVPGLRLSGVREVLRDADVDLPDEYLVAAGFDVASGAEAMRRLLALPEPPTAVFALSDEMAFGALGVAREAGLRVPGDVSVVGFDDHDVADSVGLTTVRQDVVGHGERMVDTLLRLIAGESVAERAVSPTEFVLRASTAPPPPDPVPTSTDRVATGDADQNTATITRSR